MVRAVTGVVQRRQFQDIALNISGIVLPMAAGFLVVPDLIRRLGPEKFGMLSICWMLVGYFGILDLGLGRGLTQYLARQVGSGVRDDVRAAVARRVRRWMLVVGAGWMLLLLCASPLLQTVDLHLAPELQQEAALGWVVLAMSVPLLMWASCSTGVLEAYSHFRAVNAVRVPMGCAVFVVPWLLAHFTQNLAAIIGGLWGVRLIAALALAGISREFFDGEHVPQDTAHARGILTFGGWLTVTNVIGPVIAYFDRFAIGALISMAAVTYYTVPFDVLSRLPALPVAMMGVFFPLLARLHAPAGADGGRLHKTVGASVRMLYAGWVPLIVLCGVFGPRVLTGWLGADFAAESSQVWRWLSVGVLLNGFAHVPYALLHSAGRSDITAKLHLLEFFPYFGFLWWALHAYGITGAAMAWTLRVLVDTLMLYGSAWRLFPVISQLCRNTLMSLAFITMAIAAFHHYGYASFAGDGAVAAVAPWMCILFVWTVYHGRRLFVESHEDFGNIQ
ncbi:MAG: oligosaccharide flippase family protein [Rhodoferax sp.]